jgi:hypothetical protein
VTLSCHFVTEAPAFSVVADVAIVKGETPDADQTWLSYPDGTARRTAVHVILDLPHLVVESVFGIGDGLWGNRAAAGPVGRSAPARPPQPQPGPAAKPPARSVTRGNGRIWLVTDPPAASAVPQVTRPQATSPLAKAAVSAVLNRWGDGPDTPDGVRARLCRSGRDAAGLAGTLTDEELRTAAAGVRRLYRDWAALPVGGTLRATWPLHDSWLRLL